MRNNRVRLAIKALVAYIVGIVVLGALFFLPAGSLYYEGGWRMLALLFTPMFLMGVVLLIASPDLLARRLSSKEKRAKQSGVIRFSGLIFLTGFVLAGLDWRLNWSNPSNTATTIASIIFLVGYLLYFEVMRENVWLSRTIEVNEGQKVISSGLYGIVRHPMYTSTLLMFLAMPVVLGSWWAVIPFVFYIPVIIIRILDEEKCLCQELDGYKDYCSRIRWRLFPFVW
ncbi:MAG: isoprenylcysteine carboxylmethyltransferase family protein [Tidjanibacter sp.]|nr:isoprenylcysteine carboxylmethyltransferase family protein [Tidjanibacter sp.]